MSKENSANSAHTPGVRLRSILPLNLPLLVTVLSWGFNFVAVKVLYRQMSAPAVSLVRFGIMYVLLVAICRYRGESLSYPRADFWRILLFGLMSMGIYMVLFLEGMNYAAPAEAAIVINTSPLLTALIYALIGRERLTFPKLVGTVLGFFGVVLVALSGRGDQQSQLLGHILILSSALAWAICVTLLQPLLSRYSPLRILTLSMPPGLLVLIPYGLGPTLSVDWAGMDAMGWLMLGHVAVISGVVAFICFYEGVRRVGGPGASAVMYLVPPIAAVCSWLVLGSSLAWMQVVGLVVVLTGLAISQRARMQEVSAAGPGGSAGTIEPAERGV